MNELIKLNEKIDRKQGFRLAGWLACTILGTVFMCKYKYQKGITDCQKAISKEFPEEYSSITKKVIEAFENK